MSEHRNGSAERPVEMMRRATRKHYSAEKQIRMVLEGLRGEPSMAALCRQAGIAQRLYCLSSKHLEQLRLLSNDGFGSS